MKQFEIKENNDSLTIDVEDVLGNEADGRVFYVLTGDWDTYVVYAKDVKDAAEKYFNKFGMTLEGYVKALYETDDWYGYDIDVIDSKDAPLSYIKEMLFPEDQDITDGEGWLAIAREIEDSYMSDGRACGSPFSTLIYNIAKKLGYDYMYWDEDKEPLEELNDDKFNTDPFDVDWDSESSVEVKPVSAADMTKDRFGIKESKELTETSTSGEPLPIEMPASTGKLSSDKDTKWSTWQVKDAFDFGAILDQIKDKLQAISKEGGLCYGFMYVINIDDPRAKIDEQEILGSEDECIEFCMDYIREHKDQIEQISGGIFYVEEFDDIYSAEDIDLKRYIELSQHIKANTWTYDNLDVGDWSVWINAADGNTKPDIGGNSGYTSDIASLYQELGCEIEEW